MSEATTIIDLVGGQAEFDKLYAAKEEVRRIGDAGIFTLPADPVKAMTGVPNYFLYNWKHHKLEGAYMTFVSAMQAAVLLVSALEHQEPMEEKEEEPLAQ